MSVTANAVTSSIVPQTGKVGAMNNFALLKPEVTMSSDDEARSREQFLADIIRELSRQQEEDAAAFAGVQRPNESAVFRKLCFDFPLVSDEDLTQLLISMSNYIQSFKSGAGSGAFATEFSLHEKFLENVLLLCNRHTNDTDTTTAQGGSAEIARFKIAAMLFTRFPTYILQCSDQRLMQLLGQDQVQRSWKDLLLRYQSFVLLSTMSTIGSNSGSGVVQYLLESDCLASLSESIATLGAFTVQAERVLSDLEAQATASGADTTATEAAPLVGDPLDHLIAIGMLSVTAQNDKKRVKSLKELLQYVLVTATVYLSTHSGEAEAHHKARSVPVEQLSGVLGVVKACWLHMVFLYRDLLTQYPTLIPTKAAALFTALLSSNGDAGSKQLVGKQGVDFPSAAECMYVLVFSTLAAHASTLCAHAGAANAGVTSSSITQIKATLRGHFDTKNSLSEYVDLCVRMDKYSSVNASKNDTSTMRIDAEVQVFLVEAAMLYIDDPARVSVRSGGAMSTQSGAVPLLVVSRLLPTLLFSVQALLAHQARQGVESVSVASGLTIFSSRLLRFLTLLPVCSAQGSTVLVLKYLLDFPDLLSSLAALTHTRHLAAGAADSVPAKDSKELVSPVEVLGLSTTLLLSVLQVQWSAVPGSAAASAAGQLGSAVVVDTLLSALEVSACQVQGQMQLMLQALPELLAAQQARQPTAESSQPVPEEPEILPGAFPADTDVDDDDAAAADVDVSAAEEPLESLEEIQKKIASVALAHDSDSDNEETAPAPTAARKAGAATVTAEDVAATEARQQRKTNALRYNAFVAYLGSVSEVLLVLAGEGACAPILRRMCAVVVVEKQKNIASVHAILQQKLLQFVGELMSTTTQLLQVLRVSGDNAESAAGAGDSSKAAVGHGTVQLGAKVDLLKKQLKALHGVLQGGTSSKAD